MITRLVDPRRIACTWSDRVDLPVGRRNPRGAHDEPLARGDEADGLRRRLEDVHDRHAVELHVLRRDARRGRERALEPEPEGDARRLLVELRHALQVADVDEGELRRHHVVLLAAGGSPGRRGGRAEAAPRPPRSRPSAPPCAPERQLLRRALALHGRQRHVGELPVDGEEQREGDVGLATEVEAQRRREHVGQRRTADAPQRDGQLLAGAGQRLRAGRPRWRPVPAGNPWSSGRCRASRRWGRSRTRCPTSRGAPRGGRSPPE